VTKFVEHSSAQKARPIGPPDVHYLRAAEGWLELGDHLEANEELKKITLQCRFHPQVLLVRWEIYAREGHWEFAHTIAHGLVALAPEEPVGWINRAFALHQMRRTNEAWHSLLPASRKWPNNATVAYNLACYACQLGRLDEARQWIERAMDIGDGPRIKALAAQDPDLRPLFGAQPA
jgi:predicted Zn-dependent protease